MRDNSTQNIPAPTGIFQSSNLTIGVALGLSSGGLVFLVFVGVFIYYLLCKRKARASCFNDQNMTVRFWKANRTDNDSVKTNDAEISTNIDDCITIESESAGFGLS